MGWCGAGREGVEELPRRCAERRGLGSDSERRLVIAGVQPTHAAAAATAPRHQTISDALGLHSTASTLPALPLTGITTGLGSGLPLGMSQVSPKPPTPNH